MAQPNDFNNPASGIRHPTSKINLPYRKPHLTRYGKLTELTRGAAGVKKDGAKKTKGAGQA